MVDRAGLLVVVQADIEELQQRVDRLGSDLAAAKADLSAAKLYASYVVGLVEPGSLEPGASDDAQLVEAVKTARTIEQAIVKIAGASPDRTVTTARITELCTAAGIATQSAIYSAVSRSPSLEKVGRVKHRLRDDAEEPRQSKVVTAATASDGDGEPTS